MAKQASRAWLIALCVLACDSNDAARVHGVRTDSAGIPIVRYGQLSSFGAERYDPRMVFEIGHMSPDEDHAFGEIAVGAILNDQGIAVYDRQAATIAIFSPSGEYVRAVGRPGPGPGELSRGGVLGLLPLPEGLLAVPDLVNNSMGFFDGTGALLESRMYPDPNIDEWRATGGDSVVVRMADRRAEHIVLRSLSGDWEDTIVSLDRIPQGPTREDPRIPLLRDRWVWSIADDHLVVARLTQPEFRVYRHGQLVRVVSWLPESGEPSDLDVTHLISIVAHRLGASPTAAPPQVRDMVVVPERLPELANIIMTPSGHVLVQRPRPIQQRDRRILSVFRAEGYGGAAWHRFRVTGEYEGVIEFTGNVEILDVSGDRVLGVREGLHGEPVVFLAELPYTREER